MRLSKLMRWLAAGRRGVAGKRALPSSLTRPHMEELESRLVPSTYYVSPTGNDLAAGTSQATAWKTVNRVNAGSFGPGDSVLFQGGQVFTGSILFTTTNDHATAASPLTVSSYGTGRATIKQTGSGSGLGALNVGGLNLSQMNFQGLGAGSTSDNGITILNNLAGNVVLSAIHIDNVDSFGWSNGISVQASNGNSGYNDVRVTNANLYNNLYSGLTTYGPYSTTGLASAPHVLQNVYVGGVNAYNNAGAPDAQPSGWGILLMGVNGGTIENSSAHDNGATGYEGIGIWTANSNNVTIQYDQSYRNHSPSTSDGGGFDIDWGTSNCTEQYNYSYGNDGAGYLTSDLVSGFVSQGHTIRYNISENDGRKYGYGGYTGGAGSQNEQVYNNTFYMTPSSYSGPGLGGPAGVLVVGSGASGIVFRNNIFYTTGGVPQAIVGGGNTGTALFQGNDYYSPDGQVRIVDYGGAGNYNSLAAWRGFGEESVNGQPTGLAVNPEFLAPGTTSASGYQLNGYSPVLHAGLNMNGYFGINPGPRDYFGDPVILGQRPTVGAVDPLPAADYNADGVADLFEAQSSGTASGKVEVNVADGTSGYQKSLAHIVTAWPETPAGTCQFLFGPYNGDGKNDLWIIKQQNTGTGTTEVHVLSEASGYQSYLLEAPTPLGQTGSNFVFRLGDYDGDGKNDLFAVIKSGTGSGNTEVHVLSGATNFQSWLLHTAIPLGPTGSNFDFEVGPYGGDGHGDLYVIIKSGTGSGMTEVHVLSAASNYQGWLLHTATALGQVGDNFQFQVADYNNDAAPDLVVFILNGTGSGTTEVHVLDGASSFQAWDLHTATELPPTTDDSIFSL